MHRAALLLVLLAPAAAFAQPAGMLRYPDIHTDRVVFTYAGDLWLASASGGNARRLTTHAGYEYLPKFSPDGRWIAFSAEYEGNLDVYVMPSGGGEPKRLTFHPLADRVAGWTRDGRIVFRSKRSSAVQVYDKLFAVSVDGGMPDELPLPSSGPMSFSPDGTKIAYNRVSGEFRYWRRYRGGTQSFVSIFDLKTHAYAEVPHTDASDHFPMWLGDAIYFTSDRDGTLNLYRWDLVKRQLRRVTNFAEHSVKWPSLASDGSPLIVFESGGTLYRFDATTERAEVIPIRVTSEHVRARRRIVQVSDRLINSFGLSPSGVRAVIGGRGEIFTVPAKNGETRNLTNTSDARELWPAWSPDGRLIAYASDSTGEYELFVRPQDGAEAKRLTNLGPGFRSGLLWSPDSKKILFADVTLALFHIDVTGGTPVLIDRAEYGSIRHYDWSPDAQWVVYAKPQANRLSRLFVYSVAQKRSFPVTNGKTDDTNPIFDHNGRYLYFLSKRTFTPRFSDFEKSFNFNDSTGVYVMTLRADLPSPFAPRSDEELTGEAEGSSDEVAFRIDLDGIAARVVSLPIAAAGYSGLRATENRVFYMSERYGATAPNGTLKSYDLRTREEETIIDNLDSYGVSASGQQVIYRARSKFGIIPAKGTSKVGDGAIDFSQLTMDLDPRAEWRQIFLEAWRMQRDAFYDPTMRGVDWENVKRRYEKELPFIGLRSDLNYLIGEMNAELQISHINASGGDSPEVARTAAGLLGADYEQANGRFRFRKIYRGDASRPEARPPLAEPGVHVREGDYLLAVNGRPLLASEEIFARFDLTAGRQVRLLINAKPSIHGAREVTVVPAESEEQLRYLDWAETNASRVDTGTGGRCAYIHLPDTGDNGISVFGRAFYAQTDRRCLLLDARYNSGGYIPDFLFDHLARRHLEYDAPRYGADFDYQLARIDGPRVLVINEYAGSGGDSVADYFRKYALGPIVGKRTWGGVVGIGDELPMIDGGRVNVPDTAAWDIVDGKSVWIIENRGVPPDIEVDDRPDLVLQGRDPQLERGIAILTEELKKQAPKPPRPPYGKPD